MIHREHTSSDGGTTCEFAIAKTISDNGYESKVYYPYGNVISGIYDKFATLEDVNDDTVAIYIGNDGGINPLKAKRVVRWIAFGTPEEQYKQFGENDIIYYHARWCKNNFTNNILFGCHLPQEVYNKNGIRNIDACWTLKKGGQYYKNHIREKTRTFPHDILFPKKKLSFLQTNPKIVELYGYNPNQLDHISVFHRSKFFFCYDPCCFLIILALLCGCIVVQDPPDGYTEEEWMYAMGIPTRLKGFAYGIENINYAKATIGDVYGPCMDYINTSDKSIKKFLHEMETNTYSKDKCYEYDESLYSFMGRVPKIKVRNNIVH
jgi:hypothetical protein